MDDNMMHEWRDYRRLILQKLEELDTEQKAHAEQNKKDFAQINRELLKIEVSLENQKVKVGFISSIAALITSGVMMFITKFMD